MRARGGVALLTALGVLATAGCSLDGRGSLPFAKGVGGKDAYSVTVVMADVSNLVPHAEVKVNDVTVGTVTSISMQDWHAVLEVSLADAAVLPKDALANVGQKSLLGAQYLQLTAPEGQKPGGPTLGDGDTIPIERTGTYPDTEALLIALSTFLNGSGLTQLKTVVSEMNQALDGRTDDIRALLTHLQQVSAQLSEQRQTISQLLVRMNVLTKEVADAGDKIDRSLPDLGPGLEALEAQRPALTKALTSIDQLDTVARPVLAQNTDRLVTEIAELRPVLSHIADAGNDAADALNVAGTVLYPLDRVPKYFKGDFMNTFVNIDLRQDTLKYLISEPATYSPWDRPTTQQLFTPSTRPSGPATPSNAGGGE